MRESTSSGNSSVHLISNKRLTACNLMLAEGGTLLVKQTCKCGWHANKSQVQGSEQVSASAVNHMSSADDC